MRENMWLLAFWSSFSFLLLGFYIISAGPPGRGQEDRLRSDLHVPFVTSLYVEAPERENPLKTVKQKVQAYNASIPLFIPIWKPHYIELPNHKIC
jgi:hypothetical protein